MYSANSPGQHETTRWPVRVYVKAFLSSCLLGVPNSIIRTTHTPTAWNSTQQPTKSCKYCIISATKPPSPPPFFFRKKNNTSPTLFSLILLYKKPFRVFQKEQQFHKSIQTPLFVPTVTRLLFFLTPTPPPDRSKEHHQLTPTLLTCVFNHQTRKPNWSK